MRSLFGVPQEALLLAVGGLLLLAALVLGWAGLRNPLLPRLALRSLPRRPGWAALITLSLTLSTVILSSAFTTADAMQLAARSVVAGALGAADEVVFVPSPRRVGGADLAQALANGTFLTGVAAYFPEREADRVRELLRGDDRVAGVLPVVLEQAAVAAPARGFRARMTVFGAPDELPAGFGGLRAPDGASLRLDALAPDEVYANGEAAAALGVGAGDALRLYELGAETELRVRAVAGGELGGLQPTLFMPLARLQALTGHPGELNQILIANRGGPEERLRHSWPVTVALRSAFMDDATAARLHRSFATPGARQGVEAAATRARGWPAEKLRRLLASLDAGAPTPEFEALAQDPDVLGSLAARFGGDREPEAWAAGRVLDRGLRASAGDAGGFRALDVQRVAQDQADRWGSAFTDAFVALGLFSLSTGLLLIVLVVALLALERRGELGLLRALGGRRGDVVLALAMEGALYSLLAATAGLVAGALLAAGLVVLAGAAVAPYGFRLEPAVEPASLALSYGLGLLLTFVTVTAVAWRASRFSIVAAIRDQPDPVGGPAGWRSLLLAALPLAAGVVLIRLGVDRQWPLAYAGGVTLAIIGLALMARWGLRRLGADGAERAIVSLAGLALIGWWQLPPDWLRAARLPVFPPVLELSILSGLAMLLGAVWLIAYNVGLLRRLGAGSALWRLSAAYLAAHRFRTGMTVAMFGLVALSLTLGSVLLTATTVAYGDAAAATGGWAIRADSGAPPRDLRPELRAGATTPELFRGIGATAALPVEALRVDAGDARWRSARLTLVDAGFTEAIETRLTGATGPARATWRELTRRPGTAIVGAALLGEATAGLRVAAAEGAGFRPFVLWARDTRSGQPVVRLEVIGLADARGPFGASVLTGAATVAAWPPPERATYYVSVPDGANARELAAGLGLSIPELRVQLIGQELRVVEGVRGLLALILRGFMGVGLLAGVAALGVISLRATVERRREIGVLRALGFPARAIGHGLLVETAVVALLGTLLGVAVGLATARRTVEALARLNPELRFGAPWEQLALIVLAALAASLLMTLLPARRAARLSPAEALRDG